MSATTSDAPVLREVVTSPLLMGGVSTSAEDNRYFTTVEALLDGICIRPTVLRRVTNEMRIYTEESFEPVVSMIEVDGVEAAINSANDTEYGLSAAVFTENASTGLEVARRIRSGICHVNGPTVHDEAHMPFGGVGSSG